ncbi:HK97 family phage prohead protease [Micromonospora sp. SCSIO 07396]
MPERTVYRDDLCRQSPFAVRDADDEAGDGLTLDGYGAVFDTVTTISSWEGEFEEVIARGAFRKSLRERTPKLQFDHGYHPLIGSIPIGKITEIGEDDQGLHVLARLHDNWLIEPIRDALAEESIDGMSFRFSVVREEWRDATGKLIKADDVSKALWYPAGLDYEITTPLRRTLKEVKISEVGPVVWPAYDTTSVGVRSTVTIDLGRLRDPATRRTLARAVYLADAAERSATDAPPTNQDQPSEHPATPAAPPADRSSSGEHPSATPPASRPNPAREFAQHARGYLLSINERT